MLDRAARRLERDGKTLLLELPDGLVRLPLYEVEYLEVRGNYVTVHGGGRSYTVKKALSALEREVGARLFLRTTRNVSLTRAGELFLEDAKRILDQEERALGRLRQLESSGCWELRIGYLNSPSRHFLPRLIAKEPSASAPMYRQMAMMNAPR